MIWYVHIIISVITTVILTFVVKKFLKKKDPILFSYLVTTTGKMTNPDMHQNAAIPFILVNTHTIIIRNPYDRVVKNVRVQNTMPQELVKDGFKSIEQIVTVYPLSDYEIKRIQDSSAEEIIFKQLVPGESITITYMYRPGVTFNQFNFFVKSDEGYARAVQYAPQAVYPKWLSILLWGLIGVGSITSVYIVLTIINVFIHLIHSNLNCFDIGCRIFIKN